MSEPIQDAAQNALDILGENTEGIIDEAAEATWKGRSEWYESVGTKAFDRHSERTFAKVCRALIPLLEGAAAAAEERAASRKGPG